MQNGNPKFNPQEIADSLAGTAKEKRFDQRQFPVKSLDDVLSEIRRAGGTGKLEINFKNGHARGDAKWRGFARPDNTSGDF